VAELTAAYLCALLSIPGQLRHAEYLGHWITLLKADSKAIFTATGKATEAARYLEAQGGLVSERAETEENGAGEREGSFR
jgi:antirestriction protein ArdC